MSLNLMASRPLVRSRGGHDGDGDRGLYPQYFCFRRGLRSRQRVPVVLVFQAIDSPLGTSHKIEDGLEQLEDHVAFAVMQSISVDYSYAPLKAVGPKSLRHASLLLLSLTFEEQVIMQLISPNRLYAIVGWSFLKVDGLVPDSTMSHSEAAEAEGLRKAWVHPSRYTSRGYLMAIVPVLCEQTMAAVEAMFTPRLRFRGVRGPSRSQSGEQGEGVLSKKRSRSGAHGPGLVGRTTARSPRTWQSFTDMDGTLRLQRRNPTELESDSAPLRVTHLAP